MYFLLVCLYLCSTVSGEMYLKKGVGDVQEVFEFNISHGINRILIKPILQQNVTHIVVFALSPYNEISLSFTSSSTPSASAQGTSVGLVLVRDSTTLAFPSEIYVISNHYKVISPVWMGITMYNEYQPIPGGCNQVHRLETEPNLSIQSAEPLVEIVSFEMAGTWTRKNGRLVPNSCEDRTQWTNLTYNLYAVPLANLGGQSWPPWQNPISGAKANDVGQWPLSRQIISHQLQLLLTPFSANYYGYHLGSYRADPSAISPSRFGIARRYANIYAFVVSVERFGFPPVMYIPQMMYPCPNNEHWSAYISHYNSSWSCNFILTSGYTQSISCGIAIAVAGFLLFILGSKHPRLGSSLCYYVSLCLITSALIYRFGGIRTYYSLLWSMLFGAIPVITFVNLCCCMPPITNKRITRRISFMPGFLFIFMILAAISFSPLNTYSAMRSDYIYIPVFLTIHVIFAGLLNIFPRLSYSLAIGFISTYFVLMGISVSFVPQSLWYLVPIDYFLNFASPNYLQVIRFNPIGIYDMVAAGAYVLVSFLFTIIIFRKWKVPFQRRPINAVSPDNNQSSTIRPVPPASTNNQLTIICETHHYHVRDEQPAEAGPSRLAAEPSAPRSSTFEMQPATSISGPSNVGGRYGAVLDITDCPPSYEQVCRKPSQDTKPPPPYAPGFRD